MVPFQMNSLSSLFICAILAGSAVAQPAHIILIRHAEKPDDPTDNGLSLTGKERAFALVPYLAEQPEIKALGQPAFIFAQAAPDPAKNSLRPILTVQPYAQSIWLPVLSNHNKQDFKKLADELLNDDRHEYRGKTVLICWEHDVLAEFAQYLTHKCDPPVNGKLPIDPKNPKVWAWPSSKVFGRTWVLSYSSPKSCTFHDYAQQLLYDDAKSNIADDEITTSNKTKE